jgi:hypothetical protein
VLILENWKGKTLHIPSISKTRSPWTVQPFGVIPEQGKCMEIFFVCSDAQHKIKVVISEQHKNILLFVSSMNFYYLFISLPKIG